LSPRKRRVLHTVFTHALAWGIGLLWLIPFIGLVMTSARPFAEVIGGWWNLEPFNPTFANYIQAWNHRDAPLSLGMMNSLIVGVPATLMPMLLGAIAAYGFARFSLPLKNYLFVTIVLLMALPPQMIAIPVFQIYQSAGLLNTLYSLILIHSVWGLPWIIFFMRNFLSTVPEDIEEAARVDGASDLTVFLRIVLPVTVPALVSVGVLQFMWVWSDFFFPLIFVFDADKAVAVRQLPMLRGVYHVDWGLLTAATVMVMGVPVTLFALLQRYYIRGMVGWTLR